MQVTACGGGLVRQASNAELGTLHVHMSAAGSERSGDRRPKYTVQLTDPRPSAGGPTQWLASSTRGCNHPSGSIQRPANPPISPTREPDPSHIKCQSGILAFPQAAAESWQLRPRILSCFSGPRRERGAGCSRLYGRAIYVVMGRRIGAWGSASE